MKLKLYSLKSVLLLFAFITMHIQTNAQSPSFSFQTASTCFSSFNYTANVVLTGTVAGATSYSWSISSFTCNPSTTIAAINGSLLNMSFPCPSTHTITCTAYASSSVIGTPLSQTFQMLPGPTISTSSAPSNTVCAGNPVTITASGASTYSWFPVNTTGSTVIVGPNSSSCYTVTGTATNGCQSSAVVCIIALPTPTLSIAASATNICAGANATLTASGAASYTWSSGPSTSNMVVTPTVSSCYTLTGTNIQGCTASTVACIIVNPTPTLNTTSSSSTICAFTSVTLNAGGLSSYTWYPPLLTGPTVVITPTANQCYTVVGSNATACTQTAQICISVWQNPTVNISSSAPNNTVCLGSSITLTANSSSAVIYSWATPSASTQVINFVPTNTLSGLASVTVWDANGCFNTYNVSVLADPNCADVWPGDANRDGQVSSTDVLELGLAANSTGAARTATGIAWSSQQATAWTGTVSTGWNLAHADCNGDGIVNSTDNAAITANFSFTHAFKAGPASAGNDIKLVPQQAFANSGQWNVADIVLGDAGNNIAQLYGVAFDLNYDQSKVQSDSVNIVYTASFLNNNNTNIDFGKTVYANGKLYAASVRTDHANVNGNGKIGELWYKVKGGLASGSSINLSASNVIKISSAGVTTTLNPAAALSLAINSNPVGIETNSSEIISLSCFPNPASNELFLATAPEARVQFIVKDIMGRTISAGNFTGNYTLNTSAMSGGVYFVHGTVNGLHTTLRIVIQK